MLMSRDYTEFKERLHTIDEKIKKADDINKSLSDNRNVYREFASSIDIDFSVLLTAFDFYVPALLIDIYTFCEQLFKKFIYNILDAEIDELDNKHVYKFIKYQLPENKFSPDVKIKSINSQFKKYLFMDENEIDRITLLKIPQNEDLFRSYDKLIEHRHKYAHRGINSGFDLDLIKDGFKVAEFLLNEVININNFFTERVRLQEIIEEIREKQKKLKENSEKYETKRAINAMAEKIRTLAIDGINVLKKMNTDSVLLQNLNNSLTELSKMDLRNKVEINLSILEKNKI